ncbi:MAG: 2-C-methyl-D-erythritol 4-phosphate cytidylyltransferase [Candidatus Omnitrophota bacterium]
MYVTAILLAAGKGLRLKSNVPKPLIKINSKPLIIYSLDTLGKHPGIKEIIVVANRRNLEEIQGYIRRFRLNKVKDVVLGGEVRRDSVAKGLKAIDGRTDLVLIHDGARPFIDNGTVSSLIKAAVISGAAIVGVPVKATIKKVKGRKVNTVDKTLDRNNLWEIQTPQVFKKELILKAYKRFGNADVTDDAMLVEKLGEDVSVVRGTYNNIKITTPEDLILAGAISKNLCRHTG